MLRSKILPQILNQAINNTDTKGVLLMKDDGSLIACSDATTSSHNTSKIVAAITSNIWTAYNRNSDLQYQLIDCEEGRFVITRVASLLLCVYSDINTEFGLLKLKTQKLREYLEEPLSKVEHVQ
ncbi:hypothetical protein ACTFIW_008923 [Dictyostelium discoideum]|uniref:Roadblock/LAMTOR2 domain-containing protein n=1 Tax=Dictyostelium discoideum TaxID=44689 RepID=Q54F59_DICDI|nr:hypothetical protein DDB_G0291091 [Dictyostelium discoideum AX4]EAL61893.2 hypothetical protein DDB_G0291091 [Dictyostelium discoideum AX4]|eukprot:XP_635395.3 hypothetical protein DDB_G0291091 [Dictyostelium discoideum AX4]